MSSKVDNLDSAAKGTAEGVSQRSYRNTATGIASRQVADLALRAVSKVVPVHELRTDEDVEKFFDED
ncbi:MAG TPA: hypothetical protein H9720_06015 [Candidatus Limosilactobacillus intestinigallinarum]|nr:hypothetical protein [Candidatus Limosilactobacillus intestinigallinarum]